MDTANLHTMLDRIRETQFRHTELLHIISHEMDSLRRALESQPSRSDKKSIPTGKLLAYLRPIVQSAAQWAAGLLTMAYIARGGDLVTALQTLLKLF